MDLIEIKNDGQLLSTREVVSSSQLFRVDGQVSSNGSMKLDTFAMEAYLGSSVELAKQNGMTLTPKIQLQVLNNSYLGKMIEMKIEATFSKPGVEQKQKFPTRLFLQTTKSAEKELLSQLKKCVED